MRDNQVFFDNLRANLFAGDRFAQTEDQTKTLLDEWDAWAITEAAPDVRWLAYALATVLHETDFTMRPIDEVGHGAGKLYGRADPITGQTYYGRGYVQLTWKENYRKMGALVGQDLVNNPELAKDPENAAAILFEGMFQGSFTGVGFRKYFNATADDPVNARRIINGTDCADRIATYHAAFLAALIAAGERTRA